MVERNLWRYSAVILSLFLFVSLAFGSVQGQCTPKSTAEMWSYLVDVQNYTKIEIKQSDRISAGTLLSNIYETTFVKPYQSVEVNLFDYGDESTAAADAKIYPTSTQSDDWQEITFRGSPAFERVTEITSSEYLDYTVELRVVMGCLVVRGFWHEKIRSYDPRVTLEEGKASVETVVGTLIDEMGNPIQNANITQPEPPKPKLVVLANSIDRSLASGFYDLLGDRGLEVIHATASDFDLFTNEAYIVILGGPDAPEGVGEIVQGLLTMSEGNSIRAAGARKRFTKTNIWSQGQTVTVIAGSNREDTIQSENEHSENIALEARVKA